MGGDADTVSLMSRPCAVHTSDHTPARRRAIPPGPRLARERARSALAALGLLVSLLPGAGAVASAGAAASGPHTQGVTVGGAAPTLDQATVTMAPTPDGTGYWVTTANGDVLPFGTAATFGNLTASTLNQPIVGMSPTRDGRGYWLVASDGGIFAFGDASFHGSMGGSHLNQPIVGMATTHLGGGYWLVASDGGIFAFGDASFHGSMGGSHLNQPIVGMSPTGPGLGYWLVASDGGIFAYGDAGFHGSTGALSLNAPITGMSTTGSGNGYWMVAVDGGIFAFGDAGFHGSGGGHSLGSPVVAMATTPGGGGYWMVQANGTILPFGDAGFYGNPATVPVAPRAPGATPGLIPTNAQVTGAGLVACTLPGVVYWVSYSTGQVAYYSMTVTPPFGWGTDLAGRALPVIISTSASPPTCTVGGTDGSVIYRTPSA